MSLLVSNMCVYCGVGEKGYRKQQRCSLPRPFIGRQSTGVYSSLLVPVIHDWCHKCRGMYYPVVGMVHIKDSLLLIGKKGIKCFI